MSLLTLWDLYQASSRPILICRASSLMKVQKGILVARAVPRRMNPGPVGPWPMEPEASALVLKPEIKISIEKVPLHDVRAFPSIDRWCRSASDFDS